MPAEITAWHWAAFIACIIVFLALDLGLFHRKAHVVKFKEALGWTILWVTLSLLFAAALVPWQGKDRALEFFTGYFIELSLSMDNVFVIAIIFSYFRVPAEFQHRVLFWGILGALLMRGLMIWLGVELIHRFAWLLYVFGAFLVVTGIKMLLQKDDVAQPEHSLVVRCARKFLPIAPNFDGQKFMTVFNGRRMFTPLFLVLLVVETTDLIFAVDSIPAIFGVTLEPFIVFTSNVFAILGLRSLYFVLAGAISLFRYLKVGLSLVLAFIGVKMLLVPHLPVHPEWLQVKISNILSLVLVVAIIGVSILASILKAKHEQRAGIAPGSPPPPK